MIAGAGGAVRATGWRATALIPQPPKPNRDAVSQSISRHGYLPLLTAANAANLHFKCLILLAVDPFTRERRQVQFLSANQKATEN